MTIHDDAEAARRKVYDDASAHLEQHLSAAVAERDAARVALSERDAEYDTLAARIVEQEATVATLRERIAELEAGQPVPEPEPEPTGTWWSHNHKPTSGPRSFGPFDRALADAVGYTGGPVGTFVRGYSGSDFPAAFAQTSVAEAEGLGVGAMLNVKCDMSALADGRVDKHIETFFESWPVAVFGSVTINHEPENDGPSPANTSNAAFVDWAKGYGELWKRGIARLVAVAAPVIRRRGLDVKVGGCLMGFSFDYNSDRWTLFDWWNAIDPRDVDVCEFQIDMYSKTLPGNPPVGHDIIPVLEKAVGMAKAVGIEHWSLFETANDRRQRNGGQTVVGTDESVAAAWETFAPAAEAIGGLRMGCYFHLPTGEASAKAWLAGRGLEVFAKVCLNGRRP